MRAKDRPGDSINPRDTSTAVIYLVMCARLYECLSERIEERIRKTETRASERAKARSEARSANAQPAAPTLFVSRVACLHVDSVFTRFVLYTSPPRASPTVLQRRSASLPTGPIAGPLSISLSLPHSPSALLLFLSAPQPLHPSPSTSSRARKQHATSTMPSYTMANVTSNLVFLSLPHAVWFTFFSLSSQSAGLILLFLYSRLH